MLYYFIIYYQIWISNIFDFLTNVHFIIIMIELFYLIFYRLFAKYFYFNSYNIQKKNLYWVAIIVVLYQHVYEQKFNFNYFNFNLYFIYSAKFMLDIDRTLLNCLNGYFHFFYSYHNHLSPLIIFEDMYFFFIFYYLTILYNHICFKVIIIFCY
jgi:hypothetical protein